jgi:hypothetical protein
MMRTYFPEELYGKVPNELIRNLKDADINYKTAQHNLTQIQNSEEIAALAQAANDAWIEWKNANMAVAEHLREEWPVRTHFNTKESIHVS